MTVVRHRSKNKTTLGLCAEKLAKIQKDDARYRAKLDNLKVQTVEVKRTKAIFLQVVEDIRAAIIQEFSPLPNGEGYYLDRNAKQILAFCNGISKECGLSIKRADIHYVMDSVGAVKKNLAGWVLPAVSNRKLKSAIPVAKTKKQDVIEPINIENIQFTRNDQGITKGLLIFPSLKLIQVSQSTIAEAKAILGDPFKEIAIKDPLNPKTNYEYDTFVITTNRSGLIIKIKEEVY